MRVNLGSGSRPLAGWLNVDVADIPGVDLVHDLDVSPWPIESGAAEQVVAKDVFEHVKDPITFMTECHRILGPGRVLHIRTPHFRSMDAFTDPTHRRFPTEHTFDYWIEGTIYHAEHNAAYGGVSFVRQAFYIENGSMNIQLRRA